MSPRTHTGSPLTVTGALAFLVIAGLLAPSAVAATDPGFAWSSEAVKEDLYVSGSTAIALERGVTPVIAYADALTGTVQYARRSAGVWDVSSVPSSGARGLVNLVLDGGGVPHLTYFDAGLRTIRYANRFGAVWAVRDVDISHFEGYSGLAVDTSGVPHVAYAWRDGSLRYARLDGGSWLIETVDRDVITARYPSLIVDSSGRPQIAYYGDGKLMHARWTGFRWSIVVADPTTNVQFVTLAIDAADVPKVAYREAAARQLRYAEWNGTAWIPEVVDSQGDVGWDARLALDGNGNPHVAYYDRNLGVLRYARRTPEGWATHVADHRSVVGWQSSLVVGSDGRPHIAHYRWTTGSVVYTVGDYAAGVRTWPVQSVTYTSAVVVAEVTSLGPSTQGTVSFEWRTGGGPWQPGGAERVAERGFVTFPLEDLTGGTDYEVRAVLATDGTSLHGEPVQFSTPPPPPPGRVDPLYVGVGFLVGGLVVALLFTLLARRERRSLGDADERGPSGSNRPPE